MQNNSKNHDSESIVEFSATELEEKIISQDEGIMTVYENEPNYVTPDVLIGDNRDNPKLAAAKTIFDDAMKTAWGVYETMLGLGLKPEDARYVLPNACCTSITVSGNFREWRNFLELRLSPRAQWEIRKAANVILDELIKIAPSVFEDLKEKNI